MRLRICEGLLNLAFRLDVSRCDCFDASSRCDNLEPPGTAHNCILVSLWALPQLTMWLLAGLTWKLRKTHSERKMSGQRTVSAQ